MVIKIKKIVLKKRVLEGNDTGGKQKCIVFKCSKCYQYTYAKINQKGKKCPRCRRFHKVVDLTKLSLYFRIDSTFFNWFNFDKYVFSSFFCF